MHYSEELKEITERILGGRSPRDVAAAAGCDHTLLYDMWRRGRVPRRETVTRIADNLRLSPEVRADLFAAAGYVEFAEAVEAGA